MKPERLDSIRLRLLRVCAAGGLLMAVAVSLAAMVAVDEEVNELMDDGLAATAAHLAPLVMNAEWAGEPMPPVGEQRFAWAWLDSAGRVARHSGGAAPVWPREAPASDSSHFADAQDWRLHALPLPHEQGVLWVAQTRSERGEARREVVSFSLMAALAVALMLLPLLAWRAQRELLPLERLSGRLQDFDAERAAPRLLAEALEHPEREELRAVQAALAGIARRLDERLQFEREFAAQAAHLLRTPLAGMEAQLAVALKEQPGLVRLQRVREASQRLQRLVLALLRLFRPDPQLRVEPLDARELLQSLPLGGLQLQPGSACALRADAELLAAALLNLVDNAQRHGASRLWLEQPAADQLLLRDDGRGMADDERAQLRRRLLPAGASPMPKGENGLGLRLALRVAEVHGGRLELPDTPNGFSVCLLLPPALPLPEPPAPT